MLTVPYPRDGHALKQTLPSRNDYSVEQPKDRMLKQTDASKWCCREHGLDYQRCLAPCFEICFFFFPLPAFQHKYVNYHISSKEPILLKITRVLGNLGGPASWMSDAQVMISGIVGWSPVSLRALGWAGSLFEDSISLPLSPPPIKK